MYQVRLPTIFFAERLFVIHKCKGGSCCYRDNPRVETTRRYTTEIPMEQIIAYSAEDVPRRVELTEAQNAVVLRLLVLEIDSREGAHNPIAYQSVHLGGGMQRILHGMET